MSNTTCPDCGGPATLVFVKIYCKEDCSSKKEIDWCYFVVDLSTWKPLTDAEYINENIASLLVSEHTIRSFLQKKFDQGINCIGVGKCWPTQGLRTQYIGVNPLFLEDKLKELETLSYYVKFKPFDPIALFYE